MYYIEYIEDCKRIQDVCFKHNYDLTLKECEDLWNKRNEDYCAIWLDVNKTDEEIWNILKKYNGYLVE